MNPHIPNKQSGFSLIQLSIMLAVAGLIVASTLPGGAGGSDAEKTRVTYERMRKIEQATQGFMARNQRRPYPADITLAVANANYGLETAVNANYTDGDTTANFAEIETISATRTAGSNIITVADASFIKKGWLVSIDGAGTGIPQDATITSINTTPAPDEITLNKPAATSGTADTYFRNPIVAGGVPTRTLGLPDEYGVDGFGRRIVYMVDQRATVESRCANLQKENKQGAVAISTGGDAATNFTTRVKDRVMWALLSHGKDGQGAVSMQGATLANRIKTGNTADDTLNNAFYTAAEATPVYGDDAIALNGLVQKGADATFDDLVWFDETTQNTCSFGEESTNDSLTITGLHAAPAYSKLAKGDFNGDKIDDLVIATPEGAGNSGLLFVIFGNTGKGPLQEAAGIAENTLDAANLAANKVGIVIINDLPAAAPVGTALASGDINGDGIDDIVAAGADRVAIIFGGTANFTNPTDFNLSTLGAEGVFLDYVVTGTISLATGDVNGDGLDDVLVSSTNESLSETDPLVGNPHTFLYYGNAAPAAITLTDIAAGQGFAITGAATPNCVNSGNGSDIADVNGDGFGDIILQGCNAAPNDLYVVKGRSTADFAADTADVIRVAPNNPFRTLDITADVTATNSLQFTRTDLSIALIPQKSMDFDSDGISDIIFTDFNNMFVVFGDAALAPEAPALTIPLENANLDGTPGIRIQPTDNTTDAPDNLFPATPFINPSFQFLATGDFNSDGRDDIAGISSQSNPSTGGAAAGSIYTMLQPEGGWALATNMYMFDNAAGNPDGKITRPLPTIPVTFEYGFRIDGAAANNEIHSMITLDLNDDGNNDIVVAAKQNAVDDDATVYVIWGKENTITNDNPSDISLNNLTFGYTQ